MSTLNSLPTEILLQIIPQITYSPSTISSLSLTSSRFNEILTHHEQTIVKGYLCGQSFLFASAALHPGLKINTYTDIATIHNRTTALADLKAKWWDLTHRQDVRWLRCSRWAKIYRAGLLVLYSLQDREQAEEQTRKLKHDIKQEIIRQLPATSLACLLFVLVGGMALLRAQGPAVLRREHVCHCALIMDREAHGEDEVKRREIELACEEMLLAHGPNYLFAMIQEGGSVDVDSSEHTKPSLNDLSIEAIKSDNWAMKALVNEAANFTERQQPNKDGTSKPITLIATLRQALAAAAECRVCETKGKMWEILSATGFDSIDDTKLAALATGEKVDGGGKRVGF
ncbi:Hypothetical protein R9X50_00610100 [Acrodontium crateriforme]|uniref:F-box domain-containing protein n=1 Tax=Acrodontium crateriforme TaxID=150365 RepID=A0AAQ3R9M5_9PEZI|nr:Hypothetical protein R9X50_00610100 [Acrodontium crateriforme]